MPAHTTQANTENNNLTPFSARTDQVLCPLTFISLIMLFILWIWQHENVKFKSWAAENGQFKALVGGQSDDASHLIIKSA